MSNQLCSITSDRIDPEAAKVVRRLVGHDYEAYLVGGCVRDLLVGRTPKDFDVSTSATPTEIKALFRNSRIIGRRFRLAHVFFGRKIIETATFRAPPMRPEEHSGDEDLLILRDNAFGTAEEDALRRDFTINGLFYDLKRRRVIDWVDGIEDLKARRVRTIGDPDVRFQEDPVRILRAIKFASRMGFDIDEATERAMVAHRGLIARCPLARVLEEIYRLLNSGAAEAAFRLMHRLGVLPVLFPEIASLLGPPGDARAAEPVEPICAEARQNPGRGGRPARGNPARDEPGDDAGATASSGPRPGGPRGGAEPGNGAGLLEALELGEAQVCQLAVEETWKHLDALDRLVAQASQPLSHSILLAASLAGLTRQVMDPMRRTGWCIDRVDILVSAVATRLQVSRRDRERLRQILIAQRRLVQSSPRRQIAHRDYFTEALQLLDLRHRATGELTEAINRWQEALGQRRRPPRPRPRRGRRRRRGGSGSGSGSGSDGGGGSGSGGGVVDRDAGREGSG